MTREERANQPMITAEITRLRSHGWTVLSIAEFLFLDPARCYRILARVRAART